jgi:HK97 family phage major capsid protein
MEAASLRSLELAVETAEGTLDRAIDAYEALPETATQADESAAESRYKTAQTEWESARDALDKARNSRRENGPRAGAAISVAEPDMYRRGGKHNFIQDLHSAQVLGDPSAEARVSAHHRYEVEKRALTTSSFGGLIPPNYLLDLYAKALRNGRVFADQVNHQDLPEFGMSIVVPRLTAGLSAAIQSSENSAVSTADISETDLTVQVRTIAGYSPVSRQSLERGVYNEEILMEDLVARYNAALDVQAINGDGTGVNMLGLLQTSGIKTSAATGSSNLPAVYANIADVIQQINSAVGGLGYVADKIVMHPRRWGSFVAAVDTTNRPILGISGYPAFNVDGQGVSAGYGFVGNVQGLPVFSDANVPVNLGGGSNEDAILVFASNAVHLWEQPDGPVTLRFDQQAGTSLESMLVIAGYAAFSAGRYPAACGKVTGLVPPTFGS